MFEFGERGAFQTKESGVFFCWDGTDRICVLFADEKIRETFSKFGTVVAVDNKAALKGFAFVTFATRGMVGLCRAPPMTILSVWFSSPPPQDTEFVLQFFSIPSTIHFFGQQYSRFPCNLARVSTPNPDASCRACLVGHSQVPWQGDGSPVPPADWPHRAIERPHSSPPRKLPPEPHSVSEEMSKCLICTEVTLDGAVRCRPSVLRPLPQSLALRQTLEASCPPVRTSLYQDIFLEGGLEIMDWRISATFPCPSGK